jgi:pimeloyl-ACP methyl ester carboxylesterase
MTNIKNVVLVHGAFADGSGWKAVADILKADGYKVSVAQPPETSYADDQKYTKAAIDAMGGPVVLVGHSYGGPSSPKPAIIQTLQRLFILQPLLSMKVRAVHR